VLAPVGVLACDGADVTATVNIEDKAPLPHEFVP